MSNRYLTLVFAALLSNSTLGHTSQPAGRNYPYPHPAGVQLGQGWDSVSDMPTPGVCIEFATQLLPYQDKKTYVTEVMDHESQSVALGFDMSGNAHGSIGIISGKAEGSTSIASNYKSDVRTTVFVANAVITNGQEFTGPTKVTEMSGSGMNMSSSIQTSVAIKEGPRSEIKKKDDIFLRRCGDSYVSAIVSGGQLDAIYRMQTKDYEQKVKIRSTVSASGSFGGLFGGGASTTLESEFTKLKEYDGLHISYLETGGSSGDIPVNNETLKTTYLGFAKRVSESPKPMFIVLSPYDSLPNWPGDYEPSVPISTRQKMQRLLARFQFLHRSVDDMKRDSQKDLTLDPAYAYLFKSTLGLSRDHLNTTQDVILKAWEDVAQRLKQYAPDGACTSSFRVSTRCQDLVPTDDYVFATLLPLPRNAVPKDVITVLEDINAPRADKKILYGRYLFRFYVDEPARYRCRFLGECRSNSDLSKYKEWISFNLGADEGTQAAAAENAFACMFPSNKTEPLRSIEPSLSINKQCDSSTTNARSQSSSIVAQPLNFVNLFDNIENNLSEATRVVLKKYGLSEAL